MSLPHVFGTTIDTIPAAAPYLKADPTPWRGFLDGLPGLKIGIAWSGNQRTEGASGIASDRRPAT